MRRSKVALRLQPSLLEEAKRVAESESYFLPRAGRANLAKAKKILQRTGLNKQPVAGDEV